jgi:hypothetical protein
MRNGGPTHLRRSITRRLGVISRNARTCASTAATSDGENWYGVPCAMEPAIREKSARVRPIVVSPTSKVAERIKDFARSAFERGENPHFGHRSGACRLAPPHRMHIAFNVAAAITLCGLTFTMRGASKRAKRRLRCVPLDCGVRPHPFPILRAKSVARSESPMFSAACTS